MQPQTKEAPEHGRFPGRYLTGFAYFSLAAMFLVTWISPSVFGEEMVLHLIFVVLLEFIVIHSAPFMGSILLSKKSVRGSVTAFFVIGAFYSIFAVVMSFAYGGLWPILAFWGLQGNKLYSYYTSPVPTERRKNQVRGMWAVTGISYLVFAFVTTLCPIPKLGIPGDIGHLTSVTGLWVDEPWRAMAFGFLYFTAIGLADIFLRRLGRRAAPDDKQT